MNDHKNRYDFLVDFISTQVLALLMKERHLNLEEAMIVFYNSKVCQWLDDEATGLYIESPSYVYDRLEEELAIKNVSQS